MGEGTELESYHAMRVSSQMLLKGSEQGFSTTEIFKRALLCREADFFFHTHMKQDVWYTFDCQSGWRSSLRSGHKKYQRAQNTSL